MAKIRVGVVRGGPSSEYAVSLKTGENVLKNLDAGKYAPVDILLSTRGEWYMNGMRTSLPSIAEHVDVVWNALHGTFGEDGKAQQQFEQFGIPYTGSGVLGSALGMHKSLAKERFKDAGLRTPKGFLATDLTNMESVMFELAESMSLPVIVKPVSGGSSVGTKLVRNFTELREAIETAGRYGDILIEEYVEGKEATVCVIDGSVSGEHFALFPIAIVPPAANIFYDYDAKYGGRSRLLCPNDFTQTANDELRRLAVKAHKVIGARHYSRTDFIVSPKGVYVLEINTLPGLGEDSPVYKSLAYADTKFDDFLDHVIGLAMT